MDFPARSSYNESYRKLQNRLSIKGRFDGRNSVMMFAKQLLMHVRVRSSAGGSI